MAAFAARLQGWRRTEALLYLAWFGVLEVIVVYPALVLLHSWTSPSARARWRDALWMLLPAILFTALHVFVIPKTESPIYQRIVDSRLPGTLWQYIAWTVGPSQMQFRNPERVGQGLAATWVIAAALVGALPLMLGSGTGSELRHPLGLTIVGGLIVSQMLTLFTTPVIYLYFDRLAQRLGMPMSHGAGTDSEDEVSG